MGGAGLSMTLRDAARLGRLILAEGVQDGVRILPSSVCRRVLTPRNQAVFGVRSDDPWYGDIGAGYHDQWWSYAGGREVFAVGIHGQYLYLNPSADVVIVKQSARTEASNDREHDAVFAFRAIAAALS